MPWRWTGVPWASRSGTWIRIVGAEARGPDDGFDVELGAVLEADRALAGVGGAAAQVDAVAELELAQAGADQQVAALGAAAPAVQRCRDQAEVVAVEVHAVAEHPARHPRDPGAAGQLHAVGGGEVLGDLGAGVGRSDDEHLAGGELAGVTVAGAVQLVTSLPSFAETGGTRGCW